MRRERVEPWSVPVTAVVLGVAALVAFGIGGNWWGGVGSFVILVGYAAALVLGRRFESLAVLGGRDIDERRRAIGTQAAAWAAYVVLSLAVAEKTREPAGTFTAVKVNVAAPAAPVHTHTEPR